MMVRRAMLALGACLALAHCAGAPPAAPASMAADVDYLFRLGLMRGHLLVGNALFALGEREAARTHAKHPSDELYGAVASALAERGAVGFAAELETHANQMAGGDEADVARAYQAVGAAIGRAEAVVDLWPALAGRVIALLLREAADEYAIGVVDGQLVNAHEYQDAYGFTQVALALARTQRAALPGGHADRAVFERIALRIEALGELWPALAPPPTLPHDALRLRAVADDVERLALAFEPLRRFR